MTGYARPILLALCFALSCADLHAGVVQSYSLFKVARYQQTDAEAPATPEAFAFGARFFNTPAPERSNVRLNVRGGLEAELAPSASASFDYVPPLFDNKAALDAAFPTEEYTFAFAHETASLALPTPELYPSVIPAFAPATWTSLLRLDPAAPLTIEWNQFERHPSANAAFTFVRVYGEDSETPVFELSHLSPQQNHCTIPANTLHYGAHYRIELIFSNRADAPNAEFDGALGTVGFDNLTAAVLTTASPTVNATSQDGTLLITWPATANGFVLEGNRSLSDPTGWSPIKDAPAIAGSSFAIRIASDTPEMYFRLRKQL